MGDPYVLLASDGFYYMYGTTEEDGYSAYRSADLANWESLGRVYEGRAEGSWSESCFWAPEVYERDGRFYMFFSSNWNFNPTDELENFRIGVAVADSPLGPYTKSSDNPVLEKCAVQGGEITGVGHNSAVLSKDGKTLYCVYHGRTKATGPDRVVFISEMNIEDGHLSVTKPILKPEAQSK